MDFDIEEELKKLPTKPGVYIMHAENDDILYVGKAISLRNRVRQYFRTGHGHNNSPKICKMVEQIAYFEYIVTASEMEALVLECNFIKEYHPKYNTMMTDDKGYPYIRVTIDEEYPRVLYSHNMKRDKSRYFGPYTNASAVKDTIELINKLYHLRTCNKRLPQEIGKDRPCLYHQIGQCDAPCDNCISKEDYRKNIDEALSFLSGNRKSITDKLKADMKMYSDNLEFEQAAKCRDMLESIKQLSARQLVENDNADDADIIAFAANETDMVVSVFFVRAGKLIGREHHHMNASENDDKTEVFTAFVKQYYMGIPQLPKEIIVEVEIQDKELLEAYFTEKRGSQVRLHLPQKGDKKKLLKLAKDNASIVLKQDMERILRKEKRTLGACREIAEILGIEKADRMEAFDISNISGTLAVASMVVFEKGEPRKNAYRKFRLNTVTGPDDYASMREVLGRRFTDERMDIMPDVLMMDGGKGQVNVAIAVLDSLGIDLPVCGMVKDDNHRTRALYYNNKEVSFKRGSEALLMVTALQDEAHRFAIEYHRQLRSKNQVHSILDDIPGVGPARRKALLKHFKNIESIKQAQVEDIMKVEGMPASVAAGIYEFFHS